MSTHTPAVRGAARRRRRDEDDQHVNHERWLVSYSDMITVLMALFIVLFAISQVDVAKYAQLRDSLAAGFADVAPRPSVLDGTNGALDGGQTDTSSDVDGIEQADAGLGLQGADPHVTPDADPELLAAARAEASHLEELRDRIAGELAAHGLQDAVRFRIDSRGLVLGLVADDVFFAAESAELTPTARQVLDVAAPTLAGLAEEISVEGHANVLPVSGRYATNWELSADRATQVLRHLVESDGIAPTRISSVGYGDTRPLVEGDSPEAMAANRRVDLVVLSTAPERVRALVPAVVSQDAAQPAKEG